MPAKRIYPLGFRKKRGLYWIVSTTRGWRFEHIVVMEGRLGRPILPGHVVHHVDFDPTNNDLANLVELTVGEHKRAHGIRPPRHRGEAHPSAKLTEQQVRDIRTRYAAGGTSYPKLAREYGVSWPLVWMIVKRKAWKHL